MGVALPTHPVTAQGGPLRVALAAVGMVLALGSTYQVAFGCRACDETATGMPRSVAVLLLAAGIGSGLALIASARPWDLKAPRKTDLALSLLLTIATTDELLLLGVVSGIYRPCPMCVAIWSTVCAAYLFALAGGGVDRKTSWLSRLPSLRWPRHGLAMTQPPP